LLGKEYEDQFIDHVKKDLFVGSKLAKDERGLIGYMINSNEESLKEKIFTSEEILAMILEHA